MQRAKERTEGLLSQGLKEKCWGRRRCFQAQRELSGLGLAGLGHLKITSSLKSEIEGSTVFSVRPACGMMLCSRSHQGERANLSHLIPLLPPGLTGFQGVSV